MLRPHGTSHSPTSSASSQNTTPTSPHFMHAHAATSRHPYAMSSTSLDARAIASTSSLVIQHPRAPTPPLLRPPPETSFHAYLRTWGDDEVATFLSLHRCGQHAPAFKRNDIDGRVILDLDMNTLKEMGIVKVGERVKLNSGIKDLRRRAAASKARSMSSMSSLSRVELRLNGAATPPIPDGPLSPPVEHPSRLIAPAERGTSRRVYTTRPPPLDLHPAQTRSLPHAYQASSTEALSVTPKPIQRPAPTQTSSGTVTQASSVLGPSRLNLRAPPSRDPMRRSPSPVNPDIANFADRPLPPAPERQQSSAAEYASSIQKRSAAEGRSTPTPGAQPSSQIRPALSQSERRPTAQPQIAAIRGEHRKAPSLGGLTPTKSTSPIKSKFNAMIGRPSTGQGPVHPFAANRAKDEEKKPVTSPLTGEAPSTASSHKRQPTGGYVVGSGGMLTSKSSSSDVRVRKDVNASTQSQLPPEDIRRHVVRFFNKEDGTIRTVNVSACTSGVEVLERVLKKFGKWTSATSVSTDGESDDEGDRLEVDGWGIYAESEPDDEAKPLSEASLLGICTSHRDGFTVREKGLLLHRRRKQQPFRKNMEVFFGETPPPPMSPTSPIYHGGPRLGYRMPAADEDNLTPSKMGRSKKMNRASTVSVMSGLNAPLPMPEVPPSPSAMSRSPSSASFLTTGKTRKTLYNFFGHRPPSELIANHLGEYFPAARRKELEKSRHSMMRMSSGPGVNRHSIAPSETRRSLDSDRRSVVSPPRRKSIRPISRGTISSPPPAGTILEEAEVEGDAVPRVSVSNDGGQNIRPRIDGESDQESVRSQPPLLPPFEPSETLIDSMGQYSPTQPTLGSAAVRPGSLIGVPRPRPMSILQARRGSASSAKSRMSTHFRKKDRGDTASLLTVDEITSQVEQRRASTITFDDESDEEALLQLPAVVDPGLVPQDETGEDEADDEEDLETDSDEYSSDEEEESDDDEHGKAFTSTGSRIIKWIKGALIGAGSFGSVYLGMDAQSGLLMAVKQVDLPRGSALNEEKQRTMVEALEREIELLKDLQHDNIVQYLDSSSDGSHHNIFLEYVPGGSVAALLNNYGAFEEALVRNFCRQILTGLNYLHEREIIHRDIKGANILVDNKGGIKISDFGISKKVESSLMGGSGANRPSLQGSVFWMAPEVVKQTSYTSKADIWSVGCLVVEMLTGQHPWAELTQMQAIFRIGSKGLEARPAMPTDISAEATDFLEKAFDIDYNARPTAAELLEHPFIVPPKNKNTMISAAQAKSAMAQASKQRDVMMGSMQSLSALAGAK